MGKPRILVLVESPNKVKTISEILKADSENFYVVKASVGHITKINDSGLYNMGIDPKDHFKIDYVISDDKKKVVQELREQVKVADKVILASDEDREGEQISWSLKKFLHIPENKYERITFHEITKQAIFNALKHPRKIDNNLAEAAQTRASLDKIVGYRLSPISRNAIKAKSVGRCQSAGLKLIVDRENEIINFKPETYFDLSLEFDKKKAHFKAKYRGTAKKEVKRFSSKEDAKVVIDDCLKTSTYKVETIETKERASNPKPPFTTSTFQQEVASKLGISVKTAMSCAQKLFEGINIGGKHIALTTYIRTDDASFAPEFLPILEKYVKKNFGIKYYSPVKKAKKNENAQEGHECLRCIDPEFTPDSLKAFINDDLLIKVYEIIWRRTIQAAMSAAVISETTYTLKNGEHIFTMVSRELLFDGWKKVYSYKDDEEKDGIITETLSVGELITKKDNKATLVLDEKTTTPPARYKEASFIKELEAQGIGRPSTFATIVETILSESRGYCELDNKFIKPTELGMKLSAYLDKNFSDVINIDYTRELEKDLDAIATGKMNKESFLVSFYNNLEKSINKVAPPLPAIEDKICPECGHKLVVRKGKYGPFLGCSNWPACNHIEKIVKNK